ncbi:DUF2388 domain-containing protein [Bdellovibrio sp. HCB2-146]|uniref:DUF2388 domain-containing protein n=1 Tax=Bdellovibrio sp. HCB2-146 TaxID=3394362 RepID=UPI0039BD31A6
MKLSVWPIDKMAVIALTLLLVAQAKAISIKNNGAVSEITVLGVTSRDGYNGSKTGTTVDDYYRVQVIAAKDDAALFVASNGEIRGSSLEQALKVIREVRTDLNQVSDLELALEIVNF